MPEPISFAIAPASRKRLSRGSRKPGTRFSAGRRDASAVWRLPRGWCTSPSRRRRSLRLPAAVEAYDEPFRLAGLSLATTLSGSALIALALAEGALDVEAAWVAAHVDEDWNIEKWGADAEAMKRRLQRFADFKAAALALCG